MLPTASTTKGRSGPQARPNSFFPYLRRIVKVLRPSSRILTRAFLESGLELEAAGAFTNCSLWQQMDIEYTFWQMLNLCTSPKVVWNVFIISFTVYQHTKYHKQTKNQWARDDPAFVVICSLLLSVSLIAYCAAYDHSAGHAVFVVISTLFIHFFVIGAILATICWLNVEVLAHGKSGGMISEGSMEKRSIASSRTFHIDIGDMLWGQSSLSFSLTIIFEKKLQTVTWWSNGWNGKDFELSIGV
ncbi:hypothetical protein SASPL_101164 [Salvia splendens]|uniref:Uncharacterized protein n=1 Tax=Salvia splendens TaxID=180675 RepID=A0A8X8YVB9_SALSN|nr:hypothetical protein SASPL_101164 [Salvia splendens]